MTHVDIFEIYGVPRQAAEHGKLNGLGDDDHPQYSILSSASGNPVSTPTRAGAIYIDTSNRIVYLATDFAGSADWKQAASLAMTTAQRNAISSPATGLINPLNVNTYVQEAYDTQRWRALSNIGWPGVVLPLNFVASAAFTTAQTLATNGGSIAIPMVVASHFLLQSVSVRNTDTGTQRTWGWDIYYQALNANSGDNTLTRIAASNGDETFTPVAVSTRTLDVASAPVYLGPGLYWLVVQCTHATNNFGLGSTAASSAFAPNSGQTKTTTNPNGSTLDMVAATWTKVTAIYAVSLNGRVFGQSTAF